VDLYQGLQNAIVTSDNSVATIRQRIILPSSFTVGPHHMVQNYQDAMVICRWAGCPDAFVTFTCNPQWFEIKESVAIRTVTSGSTRFGNPNVQNQAEGVDQ
jgi:hypothetical protein